MKNESYILSESLIRENIAYLMSHDKDVHSSDIYTRSYYKRHGDFIWIDKLGVKDCADSVIKCVEDVKEIGFTSDKFRLPQIVRDLQRIKNLDFEKSNNTINRVYARLEYNLTKAYLHYVAGQRYGFVNPGKIFNSLDVRSRDSSHVTYRTLFDIPVRHADHDFYLGAIQKVSHDSIGDFLSSSQPIDSLYLCLKQRLSETTDPSARGKILCNMERCRWSLYRNPKDYDKYVLVNIPAFLLFAKEGTNIVSMRVGCGSQRTKTPLLTSTIYRMDLNPQWIIPRSIVEKDIIHHAGDPSYFKRRRYFVRDRRSGKEVETSRVSSSMLRDKNYLVIQKGGEGNSLGRIIFRFNNNFSVFLHDTSTPDVFNRENRDVSHGCVRVEKPFDLAVFLLREKDDQFIDRIKNSMRADVQNELLDRNSIVRTVDVSPEVPLFITYFTLYPDQTGLLRSYPDVYGYDRLIYKHLRNYIG